jgi:hypothetical protein
LLTHHPNSFVGADFVFLGGVPFTEVARCVVANRGFDRCILKLRRGFEWIDPAEPERMIERDAFGKLP